ncbi:MAG: DUF3820 family protein [Saprospiraceae bacterium]
MEDASLTLDKTILLDIVRMPMPFGKYKGRLIKDVPAYYLEWMSSKGFPDGRLGMILSTAFIIKTHGLDDLLKNIK